MVNQRPTAINRPGTAAEGGAGRHRALLHLCERRVCATDLRMDHLRAERACKILAEAPVVPREGLQGPLEG